ncbi:cytochrome c3 family protein [Labilibacter marinus]|uniref:cytochrome c3 family protein n=1 Tax=Labilibacter marinus TaxID=1477105 RepID=UPI0009501434|nr:cytochrome c3 family protein [Labilibacter marinus]
MNIFSLFKSVNVKVIWMMLFLAFNVNNVFSSENTQPFNESDEFNLMMGERLYHGLVSTGGNNPSCISCHAKFTGEEINWNPTAMEVVKAAGELTEEQFKNAVNSPEDGFIAKVHQGYKLSDEQLSQIRLYLKQLDVEGVGEKPKTYPQLMMFLLVGGIMALALVDLIFTKKIRYKAIHILIILGGISVHLNMAYVEAAELGRSEGYMPDQPVKFSHQVHAGDNQIDCKYCHFTAEKSKSAGIPGTGVCMNCHMVVREGSHSGKSEIAKVVQSFEEGKEIEWVRIHNLPDHVFFSHAQHVNAGKLDCRECHGAVEEMHILKQENDLSMGWCLDCHKKTNVQFANDYYSIYDKYHNELSEGVRDSIKAVDIGANDCMKCHY